MQEEKSSISSSAVKIDNILLFSTKKIAKEFQFYIRNIYIMAARELEMSMPEFLVEYRQRKLPDPRQLRTDEARQEIYRVFNDDIEDLVKKLKPLTYHTIKEEPLELTKLAIQLVVVGMFSDYKIKQ